LSVLVALAIAGSSGAEEPAARAPEDDREQQEQRQERSPGRDLARPGAGLVADRSRRSPECELDLSRCASAQAGDPSALPRFTLAPPWPQEPLPRPRHGAAIAAAETAAVHMTMMGFNWVAGAPWANVTGRSIWSNVTGEWWLDDDQYWINQLGHPYQGMFPYTAARSAGLGFWWSSLYPVVASTVWEFAGETERPSYNDEVTTIVAGIVLGEVMHRVYDALRARGGGVSRAAAIVLNPMSELNSHILAPRERIPAPPSRVLFMVGALTGDANGAGWVTRGSAPRPYAGLDLVYGIPGDPGLTLRGPFSHFVLQAGWGATSEPDATLRARGLVVGTHGELTPRARGLWGMFLSFDFDTPQVYRASTSALGVGASGRLELGPELALDGSAIASAVLMGAAGDIEPEPPKVRDYRMGPGQQALLELEMLGRRARAGITLRQVFLYGLGEGAGTELRVDAGARAVLQIAGPHGVGVEAVHLMRRSQDRGGDPLEEADTTVRLYYAYDVR
jgi:hypothetical protein